MTAVVCTPLLVERLALGRMPGVLVKRTGMGQRRSMAFHADGPVIVVGVAGGLTADVKPGDVVVSGAPELAALLREDGLRVHEGQIVSLARPVNGAARRHALARDTGAIAVDMESTWLGAQVIVRTIVDTPNHPLWHPGTVHRGIKALRALRRAAPAIARWAADNRITWEVT